ncbi:Cyclic peptide transporter [Verrucomicrobia bacterium]|nr:Cyclic peptide transporter [Verrucomicrobiota bacterium]
MILLKFIVRTCRGLIVVTTVMALLSGACNAGLIASVNAALAKAQWSSRALIWGFIGLGLGKVATLFVSQVVLARFSQRAIAELRRDLIRKILAVPLRHLEELGTARILVALTDDVFNITQALLAIPVVSVNLAILLGGAVYLGFLSWQMLAALFVVILLGAVGYRLVIASAFHCCSLAREEEDKLFGYFRGLTEGIKELKLHRNRRGEFLGKNVQTTTEIYQRHNVAAETRFAAAQSWSHLLYFALIGLILFLAPTMGAFSKQTLTGYVITTLYLMGPLAGVLTSLSLFGRSHAALLKVEQLGVSLSETSTEHCLVDEPEQPLVFDHLELRNIVHSYHREQEDSNFVLGPINLSFRPGELVFLVGANGSGKSTLAKLLTGLYLPEAGDIRLDGRVITDQNRDTYRQLFSAVFADFHLFDNMLGLNGSGLDARAQGYLEQLHLSRKVKIQNGLLSTTAVSQGQRKRLALLTAYLEDRPFYLFDEWAADQDPQFKNVFYTQLLPELKKRGKTVLVITHDDKYFYLADRLIKLDYGKVDEPLRPPVEEEVLLESVTAKV